MPPQTYLLQPQPLEPVPQPLRYLYGCSTMEVLATNQLREAYLYDPTSSTFSVSKEVFTVRNRDFEEFFNTKAKSMISDVLLRLSISSWILQVLRLGFNASHTDNPIVIHVLVKRDSISDRMACELCDSIAAVISMAQWSGESIYVDVCQEREVKVQQRSTESEIGVDLSETFSEFYGYHPPCPGFSLGPEKNRRCAGSLTGFIQHQNDIFGLANHHTLNSSANLLGMEPYNYKEGDNKFMVVIPAACDDLVTRTEMLGKTNEFSKMIADVHTRMETTEISLKNGELRLKSAEAAQEHWAEALENAKNYENRIGHVYATSGEDHSCKFYEGALDWAIFYTSFKIAQNKHPATSAYDSGSGFHLRRQDKSFAVEGLGASFIENATTYFMPGPNFKSLQEEALEVDKVYFKVASRSLAWKAAQYNGIKAVYKDNNGVIRSEHCFVGFGLGEAISAKGDSGAPLLDANFRPVAMVFAGREGFAGFTDVTFATPLTVILRDIERRMGWEKGSVSYC